MDWADVIGKNHIWQNLVFLCCSRVSFFYHVLNLASVIHILALGFC